MQVRYVRALDKGNLGNKILQVKKVQVHLRQRQGKQPQSQTMTMTGRDRGADKAGCG